MRKAEAGQGAKVISCRHINVVLGEETDVSKESTAHRGRTVGCGHAGGICGRLV